VVGGAVVGRRESPAAGGLLHGWAERYSMYSHAQVIYCLYFGWLRGNIALLYLMMCVLGGQGGLCC